MPEECGRVVGGCVKGAFAHVVVGGKDIVLYNGGRQFQIGIGSAAPRILEGDEITDDVGWETTAPDQGVPGRGTGPRW